MIRIYAKQLQAGDYLPASRTTVLAARWTSGDKTVSLSLLRRDNSMRTACWNAYTKICVKRESSTEQIR
jgi:hypothetical protein